MNKIVHENGAMGTGVEVTEADALPEISSSHGRVRAVSELALLAQDKLVAAIREALPEAGEPVIHAGLPVGSVALPWVRARAKISQFSIGVTDPHDGKFHPLIHLNFRKVGLQYDLLVSQLVPNGSFPLSLKAKMLGVLSDLQQTQDVHPTFKDMVTLRERAEGFHARIRSIEWHRPLRVATVGLGIVGVGWAGVQGVRAIQWRLGTDERELKSYARSVSSVASDQNLRDEFRNTPSRDHFLNGVFLLIFSENRAERTEGLRMLSRGAAPLGQTLGAQGREEIAAGIQNRFDKAITHLSSIGDNDNATEILRARASYLASYDREYAVVSQKKFDRVLSAIKSGAAGRAALAEEVTRVTVKDYGWPLGAAQSTDPRLNQWAARYLSSAGPAIISEAISYGGAGANLDHATQHFESIARALTASTDTESRLAGIAFSKELPAYVKVGRETLRRNDITRTEDAKLLDLGRITLTAVQLHDKNPAQLERFLRSERDKIPLFEGLLTSDRAEVREKAIAAYGDLLPRLIDPKMPAANAPITVTVAQELRTQVKSNIPGILKSATMTVPIRTRLEELLEIASSYPKGFKVPAQSTPTPKGGAVATASKQEDAKKAPSLLSLESELRRDRSQAIADELNREFEVPRPYDRKNALAGLEIALMSSNWEHQHKALNIIERALPLILALDGRASLLQPLPTTDLSGHEPGTAAWFVSMLERDLASSSVSVRAFARIIAILEKNNIPTNKSSRQR